MNDAAREWFDAYMRHDRQVWADVEARMERLRRFNRDMLDLAHALNFALAAFVVATSLAAAFFLLLGRYG